MIKLLSHILESEDNSTTPGFMKTVPSVYILFQCTLYPSIPELIFHRGNCNHETRSLKFLNNAYKKTLLKSPFEWKIVSPKIGGEVKLLTSAKNIATKSSTQASLK